MERTILHVVYAATDPEQLQFTFVWGDDIIRLPHAVRVDHDHELKVHDIIRLPHAVRVDHDHELQIHDI